MDTVGTVKIEFWAVVLGATDAILNLEMPYANVDVNVHPQKVEVRLVMS